MKNNPGINAAQGRIPAKHEKKFQNLESSFGCVLQRENDVYLHGKKLPT